MECLGGNGYVEDGLAARIYRELPVNAIWEGSGNVMVLDVLRVIQREPESVGMVMTGLAAGATGDRRLAAHAAHVQNMLREPELLERRGRELVEALALLAAGTILHADAPAVIAEAFISTRFGGVRRQTYGQGLENSDTHAIVDRALPD
jgi:putative acyl-CoA dehydrogenase